MREIPFGRPIIGEEEKNAVQEILNGYMLVHGPKAKEFERDFASYTKSPHAISVSSCTAGLHLAYFYLGLGKGDEVIVPAQTHTATAHAVELTGAKPVFVDSEIETGNINLDIIEDHINTNTKAISIVHYLGMPVDMEKLMHIARKHNLFVVEDCALAIGSYYKNIHAGLWGNLGCFSFYPVKHMTTAEGGMIITQDDDIATKIGYQKAFGVDRTFSERKVPGVYDVKMLGLNYRMNEIEAVIGIEQLKRMDSFLKTRKENYDTLSEGLKNIAEVSMFKSSHGDFQSSYYCHSVILDDNISNKRLEIVDSLKQKGVGTSVYYPQAVPHFTYYREKYGYSLTSFPVAAKISNQSIALPVGPHLNTDDMKYIVKSLQESIHEVNK